MPELFELREGIAFPLPLHFDKRVTIRKKEIRNISSVSSDIKQVRFVKKCNIIIPKPTSNTPFIVTPHL
jgi:hypothetical protein